MSQKNECRGIQYRPQVRRINVETSSVDYMSKQCRLQVNNMCLETSSVGGRSEGRLCRHSELSSQDKFQTASFAMAKRKGPEVVGRNLTL